MGVLKTAAHIDDAGLPLNRFLIRIDVRDDVWAQPEEWPQDKLPPAWDPRGSGERQDRLGLAIVEPLTCITCSFSDRA